MKLASVVTAIALVVSGTTGTARAAGSCAALSPAEASGLTLKIVSVKFNKSPAVNALVVQLAAVNGTGERVFLKSAPFADEARASSGTGIAYFAAAARGIQTTQGFSASGCIANPSCAQDANTYSQIAPHSSLRFSYAFGSMRRPTPHDDITFPVILVARFGAAAPLQPLRFDFNDVPAGCS